MKTECVRNTNFLGEVVITNNFSRKPKQSFVKAKEAIEGLVNKKDYILCLSQDYTTSAVNIELKKYIQNLYNKKVIEDTGVISKIGITSKPSRYVEAAKKLISDYEADLQRKKEEQWEKENNKQALKEIGNSVVASFLAPLTILCYIIIEGFKDIKNDLNNLGNKAKTIATKKG